jgi:hypothetical protein
MYILFEITFLQYELIFFFLFWCLIQAEKAVSASLAFLTEAATKTGHRTPQIQFQQASNDVLRFNYCEMCYSNSLTILQSIYF